MCRRRPIPQWAIGPKQVKERMPEETACAFFWLVMGRILGMNGRTRASASVAASVMLAAAALTPAHAADAVADFYKGKTVQVLVGFGPGGGYDLYARTLARYLGRHIPGNPTVVPQNMPGAGGIKVMNYLYNVARKDGTVIGTFARGLVVEPLLGHAQGTQFEAAKFNWIGSVS